MEANKYTIAGWLAIAAAIMLFPEAAMGMLIDIKPAKLGILILPWTIITALEQGFSVYVMLRFKHLLNNHCNFRRVDTLILIMIIGTVLITSYGVSIRWLKVLGIFPMESVQASLISIGIVVMMGIPLGVIGIVFGVRLLKLEDSLGGFLKPLAYLFIIMSICFATMILALVGMLLSAAASFILGLVFLKHGEPEMEPEFV